MYEYEYVLPDDICLGTSYVSDDGLDPKNQPIPSARSHISLWIVEAKGSLKNVTR